MKLLLCVLVFILVLVRVFLVVFVFVPVLVRARRHGFVRVRAIGLAVVKNTVTGMCISICFST